jgi:WD40 repeat protein
MALGVDLKKDNNTVYSPADYHPHSLPGLPEDMQLAILSWLPPQGKGGLAALSSVSHYFEVLASDNGLWKRLFQARFLYLPPQIPKSYQALYKENNAIVVAIRTGQLHTITLEKQREVSCAQIYGDFICTGSVDGTIVVLDRMTGKTICTISSKIGHILCIDMSTTSSILCAGGEDGVQAWRVDAHEGIAHLIFSYIDQQDSMGGGEGWIKIHENRWLCAAGWGRCLSIWDLDTKAKVSIYDPLSHMTSSVWFFEDGIVCTARGTRVVLRDLKTGRVLQKFSFEDNALITPAGMMIYNNKFLCAASDTILVWDVLKGDSLPPIEMPPLLGGSSTITCIDIKNNTLCVGWSNGWVSVHNLETGGLLHVLEYVGTPGLHLFGFYKCLRVKITHDTILVSQSMVSICFWDLTTGQKLHEEHLPTEGHIRFVGLFDIQGNTFLTQEEAGDKITISRFK